MTARPEESAAVREAVDAAYAAKYGLADAWYGLLLRLGAVPVRLLPPQPLRAAGSARAPAAGALRHTRGLGGRRAMTTVTKDELRRQREAVVRRHMESENVHDFDATIGTFSHPRYEIVPTGAVHDGEEAVRAYFKESRAAFPDQRNELISLRQADDAVIVEFWLLGTHRGPLLGLAPTGREFRCRMTAFFLFEGPWIVCERVYFDSATILRQLTA